MLRVGDNFAASWIRRKAALRESFSIIVLIQGEVLCFLPRSPTEKPSWLEIRKFQLVGVVLVEFCLCPWEFGGRSQVAATEGETLIFRKIALDLISNKISLRRVRQGLFELLKILQFLSLQIDAGSTVKACVGSAQSTMGAEVRVRRYNKSPQRR